MASKYLDNAGLTYLWGKLKAYFQPKLVSGTNIKTINNQSLLGSGNIAISGGASGAVYITEQGTSGIWTYRKWNSGIAECWGTWAGTLSHYATAGGFYGFTTTVYFPSGLFNARPTVCYNSQVANGFSMTGATLSVSSTTMGLYALGQVGNTQTCTFDIQVRGRWK